MAMHPITMTSTKSVLRGPSVVGGGSYAAGSDPFFAFVAILFEFHFLLIFVTYTDNNYSLFFVFTLLRHNHTSFFLFS